jgi:hypothetical protein
MPISHIDLIDRLGTHHQVRFHLERSDLITKERQCFYVDQGEINRVSLNTSTPVAALLEQIQAIELLGKVLIVKDKKFTSDAPGWLFFF